MNKNLTQIDDETVKRNHSKWQRGRKGQTHPLHVGCWR